MLLVGFFFTEILTVIFHVKSRNLFFRFIQQLLVLLILLFIANYFRVKGLLKAYVGQMQPCLSEI